MLSEGVSNKKITEFITSTVVFIKHITIEVTRQQNRTPRIRHDNELKLFVKLVYIRVESGLSLARRAVERCKHQLVSFPLDVTPERFELALMVVVPWSFYHRGLNIASVDYRHSAVTASVGAVGSRDGVAWENQETAAQPRREPCFLKKHYVVITPLQL